VGPRNESEGGTQIKGPRDQRRRNRGRRHDNNTEDRA
jgi:hypothetical protein